MKDWMMMLGLAAMPAQDAPLKAIAAEVVQELAGENVETLGQCAALARADLSKVESHLQNKAENAGPRLAKARQTTESLKEVWGDALAHAAQKNGAVGTVKSNIDEFRATGDAWINGATPAELAGTRRTCMKKVMAATTRLGR